MEKNAWMYPYQHDAERKMTEIANKFAATSSKLEVQSANPELETLKAEFPTRILNQAARELLLAQSSDWAFQIYKATTVEYASRRFRSHIHRFDLLYQILCKGSDDGTAEAVTLTPEELSLLEEIESRDNIFPEIDHRIYRT